MSRFAAGEESGEDLTHAQTNNRVQLNRLFAEEGTIYSLRRRPTSRLQPSKGRLFWV